VIVGLGLELRLHLRELVLQRHEVDDDVMVLPEVPLVTEWAVGTASDDIAQRFDRSHHVHGDETGGLPGFQRPIDVKADKLHHACASWVGYVGYAVTKMS
jgi:hypothetical protein